jgi:acetyl-CoA carboxylase beta subunit
MEKKKCPKCKKKIFNLQIAANGQILVTCNNCNGVLMIINEQEAK